MNQKIKLSSQQHDELILKAQQYCVDSFGLELEQFDAAFMVDFFIEQIGKQIYNKALDDAKSHLEQHFEVLGERLYDLEKY
ncbi:hypothetical protein PSECIP111951_01218 [Pseudoalteromonas holothuriae]|uniref:DUF2164 domain-containing protein n=1 Tax=Pseudoalteromonas holothuriae TaxID=2963714 RepID=A0A9W4VZF8_9GAMM|nr:MULTISPECIES: DUF2164 domain-containing protein [unclassified Pseudoalteromonas]CAH9055324.1 hypothetical protein PSECIP111951_01218 [Pseudoalteromonas sp. CIP111951]CAH9058023.1 hypothetical protein PSECIP111854_02115 [Pseudoalteromonas sp. CIP111854]